jgi:uncharacterized protein RhaS with RHS repeats
LLAEIGVSYYKARLYHSSLGRFMQIDSIGYKDGMNWFAYLKNDPLNAIDPMRLYVCIGSEENGSAVDSGIARVAVGDS